MSGATGVEVTREEARRIAVRAQLLDGSASDVLDAVRRLGFLQIDPISTVAPPQYLVLWSRLGPYERGELDRLLVERKLYEWNAFIWPKEDLPLIQAKMRERWGPTKRDQWAMEFLKEQSALRRYVLRELKQRGPLPSRELEHTHARFQERTVWWGTRAQLMWMLELLHQRGRIAVAGRDGTHRLWDLAERVYPEAEAVPAGAARKARADKRFRSLGVKLERGRLLAHPDADARPVGNRVTFVSPFDRLVHDRARAEAIWGFYYRLEMYVPKAKREYGYYVLPILHGDDLVGRIEPVFDRKAGVLRVNGVWWEPGKNEVPLDKPLRRLASFLGADSITT
ncbi:MAG TPA: crosslink repair DNA glycosylase YcaQ family protein [Gaiellaceae bacterium]|nr:crosslink repair DNA glycosylase YcaQ family protein [Gaiellaceae bacterium]